MYRSGGWGTTDAMTASAVSRPSLAAAVSSERGRTRRSRSAAVALIAAVALATTACSSDSDATPAATLPSTAPTTATTAPTTTSTTEALSPEEEVGRAYLKANAIFFEVAENPNPDDPRLAETRVDPNLQAVKDSLQQLKAGGQFAQYGTDGRPVPVVRSVTIEGDSATISSCLVDDGQVVRSEDTTVVDDDVVTKLLTTSMLRSPDGWRVQSQRSDQTWTDGSGCDR